MRELFGVNLDTVGLTGIHCHVSMRQMAMQTAIDYYNQGVLLPGVTLADRHNPSPVTGFFDENGQELTEALRQQIAERMREQGLVYTDENVDFRTFQDGGTTEPLGTTPERVKLGFRMAPPPVEYDPDDVAEEMAERELCKKIQRVLNGVAE